MKQASIYQEGFKVRWGDHVGVVIKNFKLPDDICIQWENGLKASYDEEFLTNVGVTLEKDMFQELGELLDTSEMKI